MNHKHLMGLTIIIFLFGLSALAKGDVVLLDDFDGVMLNPNWSKSYQNVEDPYWNYSFSTISSNLTVSEILPDNINNSGGGTWSKIILSRNDFDPLGNFTVTCNFSWDEEGQDTAMQNLWFRLYDDSNNIIAQAGYYDPWCLHEGSKFAAIGLESSEYDYPPLAGDASVIISREGSDVNVYWDDQLLLTGTNDSPFSRIDIAFYYYPNVNPSCQSIFGTESVDLVKIEDEAAVNTTTSSPDEICDLGISVNVSDVFSPFTTAEILIVFEITAINNGTIDAEGIILDASIIRDPGGLVEIGWRIPPDSFSEACPESSQDLQNPINYSCDLASILPGGEIKVGLTLLLSTAKDTTVSYTFRVRSTTENCILAEVSDSFISYAGPTCFIATAAYGSPIQPYVRLLRKFRDRFMLTNPIGKTLADLYSRYSPDIAAFISNHDSLRTIVGLSLLPLVGFSWAMLNLGPIPTFVVMLLFAISAVALSQVWRKYTN